MNNKKMTKANAVAALVLKLGETTKWRSGANGNFTTKKGKVVAIIAPGKTIPATKFPTLAKTARAPRNMTSYIIDVNGKHHFPRTGLLQKI